MLKLMHKVLPGTRLSESDLMVMYVNVSSADGVSLVTSQRK